MIDCGFPIIFVNILHLHEYAFGKKYSSISEKKATTVAPIAIPTTLPVTPITIPTTLPVSPITISSNVAPTTQATTVVPITQVSTIAPITMPTAVAPITQATTVTPKTKNIQIIFPVKLTPASTHHLETNTQMEKVERLKRSLCSSMVSNTVQNCDNFTTNTCSLLQEGTSASDDKQFTAGKLTKRHRKFFYTWYIFKLSPI